MLLSSFDLGRVQLSHLEKLEVDCTVWVSTWQKFWFGVRMHKDRYLYVYIHIIIHFLVLYDYMTAVVVIYVVPEFIVIFEIGYHDLYYHWLNFIICTIIIHYQLVLVLFTGLLVIFKNSSDMFWRSKVEVTKDMIWRCSRTSNSWRHQHPSSPSSNDKNPRNPSICMGRSGWRHKISVF